jgi:hypothetical protein
MWAFVASADRGAKGNNGGKERERDKMDGQGASEERCGSCNAAVPVDDGYENGRGDLLCTECFVDQWGPATEDLATSFGVDGAGIGEARSLASVFSSSEDLGGFEFA